MLRYRYLMLSLLLSTACLAIDAQTLQVSGTQVIVPATGEITLTNDQARATLTIEEQDKDQAAAASRVNQKMQQGIELLRRQDPQAQLKTRGYFAYAVYADEPLHLGNKPRAIVAWRVGQSLEMTTGNLAALPKTVAAAQGLLALNGLEFGLSPASSKKQDEALIAATYQNLNQRIASITRAMARTPADVVVETLDFGGNDVGATPRAMMMHAAAQQPVAQLSFEAGETTLSMRLVAKIRIK